jgi:hypothetical protein
LNKENYIKREPKDNKLILAYGEVTGHHHSISLEENPNVELLENLKGDMILEINGFSSTLTHQEHASITLEPGLYEVYIYKKNMIRKGCGKY